jgi:hypothetical protein
MASTFRILSTRVAELKKSIALLEQCIQVDQSQNLTLTAGMKISIEAGAAVSIKSTGNLKLKSASIRLNPLPGQSPQLSLALAKTAAQKL